MPLAGFGILGVGGSALFYNIYNKFPKIAESTETNSRNIDSLLANLNILNAYFKKENYESKVNIEMLQQQIDFLTERIERLENQSSDTTSEENEIPEVFNAELIEQQMQFCSEFNGIDNFNYNPIHEKIKNAN